MAELRWRKTVGGIEIVKVSVSAMDNNVYLLSRGDEAILVDGSDEADAILGELGPRRLAAILQTHNHWDHLRALPMLVDMTGAPVHVHPDDSGNVPVAWRPLSDGQTFETAGIALEVLHTPGHTPGGVCFVLREEGQTHLFSGDTLFPGGPGGTFGNAEAFATIMRSLDAKLLVLPDETHVYPGHGDDTTIGAERGSVAQWRARGW